MISMDGFVYIITNKNFEGYVKIGITKNIKKRLQAYQTSSPFRDYKIEYYVYHPNIKQGEKDIHKLLEPFALSRRNEWVEICISMAKSKLEELVENL